MGWAGYGAAGSVNGIGNGWQKELFLRSSLEVSIGVEKGLRRTHAVHQGVKPIRRGCSSSILP